MLLFIMKAWSSDVLVLKLCLRINIMLIWVLVVVFSFLPFSKACFICFFSRSKVATYHMYSLQKIGFQNLNIFFRCHSWKGLMPLPLKKLNNFFGVTMPWILYVSLTKHAVTCLHVLKYYMTYINYNTVYAVGPEHNSKTNRGYELGFGC